MRRRTGGERDQSAKERMREALSRRLCLYPSLVSRALISHMQTEWVNSKGERLEMMCRG